MSKTYITVLNKILLVSTLSDKEMFRYNCCWLFILAFITLTCLLYLSLLSNDINREKLKFGTFQEFLMKDKFMKNEKKEEKKEFCTINSKPRKSIFYVKIHKTGSTTLRSTLLTYGRTYNLTICMDATNLWGLNWPYEIDSDKLTKLHEEKCGIVAEELIYDKIKVKQLMADDVFKMASVRHPIPHFLSLYKYSRMHEVIEKLNGSKLHRYDGMRIFLRNPSLVQNLYATLPEESMRDSLQINLVRRNLQLFSLGVTNYDFKTIMESANEMDFFVVAEQYDESMIILRDKLCCSIEDVLYRKQNIRRESKERQEEIPNDIRNAILDFNKGDLILYMIALKRLARDIENHSDMNQALGILRFELQKYEEKCLKIPEVERHEICPPITNGQIGLFAESVRREQRKKLFKKLKEKFKNEKRISGG